MSDVREALRHTLQEALPDVVVAGSLLGTIDPPAVVVRRGTHPAQSHMGDLDRDPSWDLVLLVSSDDESRVDELDDLVDMVLEVLDAHDDLDGAVDSVAAKEIGEEELIGVAGQVFLSCSIEVEVLA